MDYSNNEMGYYVYKSLISKIESEIRRKKEILDKNKANEGKGLFGFVNSLVEKGLNDLDNNSINKDIHSLSMADRYLKSLYNTKAYKMSDICFKDLEEMMMYLDSSEVTRIKNLVDKAILDENKKRFSNFDKQKSNVLSLLTKSISNNKVTIYDDNDKEISSKSVSSAFDYLVEFKKKNKTDKFNIGEVKYEENTKLKEQIDTILSDNKYSDSSIYKNIRKNYDTLVSTSINISKLERQTRRISSSLETLKSLPTEDREVFMDVISYSEKILNERNIKLNRYRERLNKFDLNKISELSTTVLDKKRKEEEKKEKDNRIESELESLYYSLATLDKGSYDEIAEVQNRIRQLEEVANSRGDIDISKIKDNAKNRYVEELVEKEMYEKEDKDKERLVNLQIVAEDALEKEALNVYREKHRKNWSFEDVEKGPPREEIEKIISSLKYNAKLSPEERALIDLIRAGSVHEKATLETLTPQERITLNKNVRFYQDDKYSYVKQYKEYLEAMNQEMGNNNIHRM